MMVPFNTLAESSWERSAKRGRAQPPLAAISRTGPAGRARLAVRAAFAGRLLGGLVVAAALVGSAVGCGGALARAAETDWLMLQDPRLEWPHIQWIYPEGLARLWREALASEDDELRRRAADAVAAARRAGMPGLAPLAEPLARALEAPDATPPTMRAIAAALDALDAREAAPLLNRLVEDGQTHLAPVVEPALARWDHEPARARWRRMLGDPSAPLALRVTAATCLGRTGDASAVRLLVDLAANRSAPGRLRLAAAQAAGALGGAACEAAAAGLLDGGGWWLDDVAAVRLLAGGRTERTKRLLERLAARAAPPAAAEALAVLTPLDPERAAEAAAGRLGGPDGLLRRRAVEALAAAPSAPRIALLGPLMDDVHPDVRRTAQVRLKELANEQPALRDAVLEQAREMLAGDSWRGLEQAALLSGALDDRSAATRLLELLRFPRPEVRIAAAWALRVLAVPSTLADVFAYAEREVQRSLRGELSEPGVQAQLVHVFEMFGAMGYQPADALLRRGVPKSSPLANDARAAAIWALGRLHAGKGDAPFVQELIARLSDEGSETEDPEDPTVRAMSAVALGRIRAAAALAALREYVSEDTHYGAASAWALEQLTGRSPGPRPVTRLPAPVRWPLRPQ